MCKPPSFIVEGDSSAKGLADDLHGEHPAGFCRGWEVAEGHCTSHLANAPYNGPLCSKIGAMPENVMEELGRPPCQRSRACRNVYDLEGDMVDSKCGAKSMSPHHP